LASRACTQTEDGRIDLRTGRNHPTEYVMNAISRKRTAPSTRASAYSIVLEPSADDDGIWTAEVPAFSIVTEGDGSDGARKAALDAIRGYVEVANQLGKPIPGGDLIDLPGVAWSAAPPVASKRARRKR
jgi:predicted RNase H-like HicB family nuclease